MFNLDFTGDAVSVALDVLAWLVIGLLAVRLYRKQQAKPRVWKVVVAILAGVFAFSIDWEMEGTMMRFPVLPLGVWILYAVLNRVEDRWDNYRRFAWLGFAGNFIFLAASLLSILLYSAVYPEGDLSTHIADTDEASIIATHPSGAGDAALDRGKFADQLASAEQERVDSDGWYEEMFQESDGERNRNERFPYQMTGVSSKWGSGKKPIIYVEEDGKGILVSTSRNQYYYRLDDSVLKGGAAR
ncbi:hypothetical protein AS034_13170 [[Bacillus] enclensis]|uniref:Uncharacterized protein n=1 Tax=[Bacillus] enclensis TaxID=1402860 RepID=A0A0V8HGY5_9BACI|nr:hypothetical protein [[Bacillus] enclensis]KSU61781.1 hypothetical protein AS034_13170 [[Bacillus] enclensis]SCC15173.1 hypothetical protein GA0061094_2726 [[Bacillus] enclensis]